MKKQLYGVVSIWVSILCLSLYWNVQSLKSNQDKLTFKTANALFELMVTARLWNSSHNGVYVQVTDQTQPNPYLEDSQRDLECNGLLLTKINPAFMTRQISELTHKDLNTRFHVAGLNPLNPQNQPDVWEKEALESFSSSDISEKGEFLNKNGVVSYAFMKGLRAEKSCLECHKNKSYKLNDIIGGIRINLLNPSKANLLPVILLHIVFGCVGVFLILFFGLKLIKAYKTIQHQAIFDALTGIPNRRCFNDRFLMEARRASRLGSNLSIIMADIDHFKNFNDAYGHDRGDLVLTRVAKSIDATLKRPVDFCARYGGEEFIIILPDTDPAGAIHIAGLILEQVRGLDIEHKHSDADDKVTISLGVASQKNVPLNYEDIIKNADIALYLAKSNGRNRFEVSGTN
ncbi:MAG: diguanylate cyclase [Desulfobacula sp.]|nr:diguanylate cyclase [Desulfobacula sp.]